MIKKTQNTKQLSLIERFERSSNKHELFIKEIDNLIKNVKYYRTCTSFCDIPHEIKHKRIACLDTILYWLAQLEFAQTRGLAAHRERSFDFYQKKTQDGVFLHMAEPIDPDTLSGYYQKGAQRTRVLFFVNRDILRNDAPMAGRILDFFTELIRS